MDVSLTQVPIFIKYLHSGASAAGQVLKAICDAPAQTAHRTCPVCETINRHTYVSYHPLDIYRKCYLYPLYRNTAFPFFYEKFVPFVVIFLPLERSKTTAGRQTSGFCVSFGISPRFACPSGLPCGLSYAWRLNSVRLDTWQRLHGVDTRSQHDFLTGLQEKKCPSAASRRVFI